MYRRKLKYIFAFFLVLPFYVFSQADYCDIKDVPFSSGEHMEYQVYYNWGFIWIPAAYVSLDYTHGVYNGNEVGELKAVGVTIKAFDNFFSVRDTLVSYIDEKSMVPYNFEKHTNEGKWKGVDFFDFVSLDSGGYEVSTRLKRHNEWKEKEIDTTYNCGFDILSSVYRMRCMNCDSLCQKGKQHSVFVRLDDGEYEIFLTYLGTEKISLRGYDKKNEYKRARKFAISLIEGTVFNKGAKLYLWISDDDKNIPLYVEAPVKVGSVKGIIRLVK